MGHRPFFEASCITGRREASITVVPGAQFFVGGAVRSAVTRAPRRATDSRPYAARIGGAAGDDGLPRSSGDQSPGAHPVSDWSLRRDRCRRVGPKLGRARIPCLRRSPRAPIDAGLANASDTSYIYEVLDSPSFPISQPQSRPVGRKVAAQPLWAGCHKPLCGRRLNCASSDWPLSGRWR